MAAQSGSVVSSACLLLLVLLPLTLAQNDCYGSLYGLPPSPNWPDCLSDRLNGTYYIRPEGSENTSCPTQPCLTFTQLRDVFFVLYAFGRYETAPNGDTSLVFLPGTHSLDSGLYLRGDNNISFSLTGIQNHSPPTAVINGIAYFGLFHFKDIIITHLKFNNCRVDGGVGDRLAVDHIIFYGKVLHMHSVDSVNLTHLQFNNCEVLAGPSDLLVVDHVIFDGTLLDVRSVDSVNITNSNITATTTAPGSYYCHRAVDVGVLGIDSRHTRLRNVSFASDHSPCGNAIQLRVRGGDLDIADSAFLWKANHIVLSNTILNVSGTVQFENGNPVIQALNSIINLAGTVGFENGNIAILALNSTVNLAGSVSFINNTAYQGGAMSLSDSHVSLADNAHVIFQGNHADHVGGAIFSTGNDIANYVSVGLRANSCQISFGVNSRVVFINNTAESGGSAMYGVTASKLVCGELDRYFNPYDALFDILAIEPDDFSAVSSDPLRVCICPDQFTADCLAILPDQNSTHLHYTVYPGQNFTIPAAVVGFNFALTSGSAYAKFLNSDASLGSESQYVQGVSHTGCAPLQYSVLSNKKQETLVLTTNGRSVAGIPSGIERDIQVLNENSIETEKRTTIETDFTDSDKFPNPDKYYNNNTIVTNLTDGVFRMAAYVPLSLQDTPIFISVTLLDCPLGFTLSNQTAPECKCYESILKHNLTCNINDQTVYREGTTWINASFTGNSSNGVIVHLHCPFGYCKQEPVDVDLTNPDTQCAFDHSGTLCGACKPNFSLALGSSQCLPNCSNKYLSLLIPFVLAGFALVFFIKVLNLTVSQGTINGLIFYANIVAANQSIFFPAQYNKFLSILSVFISWLNLDLGIETCFIKGLDGYWNTWLQFVFPFYVWAIVSGIILVSHYSTRATKIFGKNSLSVLATLFLLSYAKLLRSIITIFSFTSLVYSGDSTSEIWAFDGSVQYLSPKHIPLFLFAIVFVLLLWLPYTAVLLSAQWLRTQTHRKGLRWLKPFLDAYCGPFKDKHHYWVGVLLVVRGVLFVFFASFFAIENNVNLLLVVVSSIALPIYTSITARLYNKLHLTILENSFFLNLGVLAAGTFYIRLVGGSQEALVTTSVGIAFLQFVVIFLFHSYRFAIVPFGNKCKDYAKARAEHQANHVELEPVLNFDSSDSNSDDEDRHRNVVTHSEVCLSELREEAAEQLLLDLEHHQSHVEMNDKETPSEHKDKETAEHQLPPAVANQVRINENTTEIWIRFDHDTPQPNINRPNDPTATEYQAKANQVHFNENTEERLIPFERDTPRPNINRSNDSTATEYANYQARANQVHFNENIAEILIPFERDTPIPNIDPLKKQAAANKAAGAPKISEAAAVPLDELPPPQESNEPSRYFAAERESRFIDFNAPRESLLEFTQYHVPEERNEPTRYFAAEREGSIDFTAPRESLLEFITH